VSSKHADTISPGTLLIIATPLGNADDLSPRARKLLAEIDCLYCEDTRNTSNLLKYLGIPCKELRSLHSHNEDKRIQEILHRLQSGDRIGLCSDAGTPAISDPGSKVTAAVFEAGFRVSPIPGPSAPAALLSASGFPSHTYTFLGFLPKTSGPQRKILAQNLSPGSVVVAFVPARDVRDVVRLAADIQPDAIALMGRELTKEFEELLRLPVVELADELDHHENLRGEVSLAFWTPPSKKAEVSPETEERIRTAAKAMLAGGLSRRDTQRILGELTGQPKRWVLALILALDGDE
tara:strand:+ start:274 stop:1152 length:879 start_codon:yes stop_codon:yes gene_type:complete